MAEVKKPVAKVAKAEAPKKPVAKKEVAPKAAPAPAPKAEAAAPKATKTTAAKTTKTTAAKTTTKKTETAAKTTTKAAKETVHMQFAGKSYTTEDLVKIAKDVWQYDLGQKVSAFKTVELYVKPEESAVYYVINGDVTGCFGI